MKRLREIIWDEAFWLPKPRWERQADLNECQQKFWAVMPKLCKEVDTITLVRRPLVENDPYWLCSPLLSELHHLQSLRRFIGDLFSCDHYQSDLLIKRARTTQNSIFSAFSQLREPSLADTELQALPDIQFPSLVTLSLVNVTFDANGGLLRILESCPVICSLHLDFHGSAMLVPHENQGGPAPSLNGVPLLTSFTGHYQDAQILFFNPLPDGRLRRISRLKVLGSTAEELLPSLVSAFEHSEVGIGQDLLALTICTIFDRMIEDKREYNGLLWVTWLGTIIEYCPKLRGLIIGIEEPETEYQYLDETDDWGPTLSRLADLTVLKLPATFWQEKTALSDLLEEQNEQRTVERCLQWFTHLRLFFPTDWSVLVIDPEENKAVNIPKRENLIRRGRVMKRYWALYGQLFWNDFDEEIERLIT